MGKFINPFTDFGFKHIFGREMDKDILIEFLNDLLEGEHTIKDLRIMNNERLPETEQGTLFPYTTLFRYRKSVV